MPLRVYVLQLHTRTLYVIICIMLINASRHHAQRSEQLASSWLAGGDWRLVNGG
ncbi:hypothetical protein BH20CHL4_BH20CHL4_02880 [soil metagenome]